MSLPIESKYVRLISSRLRNFKQKNDYLWNFSCPFCGDSQKNKTKARGYVYAKGNNLFYRCHNCGIGTNVGNLVKHADPSLYQEFVLERYKSGESNTSSFRSTTFNVPTTKFGKIEKQKVFQHAEYINRLPSGHFCLEYLTKRKIPTELYNKLLFTSHYKKFVDEVVPNHGKEIVDDARLVIPYYNEYDELIAVSGRALETGDKTLRYVTIRTNNSEDKLVYGLDRINLNETVYMVEGPIDSLFLDNCIASGDANLALTAKNVKAKKIILVWDNECRNKEIVKMMQNAIDLQYDVVIWPETMQGKDINEMILHGCTKNEIQRIISSNTYNGLKAQVQLNNWKKV